jgi:hypothetical protein
MDSRLEFALRVLPTWVPNDITARPYASVMNTMCDIVRAWPDIAQGPRFLGVTPGGNSIVEFTFGNGADVTVVDVMPHGGEFLWLLAAPEYAIYLCTHAWVLRGRKVRMLFANADDVLLNLSRWGTDRHPNLDLRGQRFWWSVICHWRHPDPLANDHWSWPFLRGDRFINQPTAGALAGMRIMHETYDRGDQLVLWDAGHNFHVGAGAQFLAQGPGASQAARILEASAVDLGVPLDLGPPDVRPKRRLAGTRASWYCSDAADLYAWDPTARTGGTPLDYGRNLFPDMAIVSSEVAMMRPLDPTLAIWRGQSQASVNWDVRHMTQWLDDDLPTVLGLAMQLDPAHPDVAATQALKTASDAWGTRPEPLRPLDEVLEPHEAFWQSCARPLYRARSVAPALFMLYSHVDEVKALGHDPYYLAGMLKQAMGRILWHSYLYMGPAPLAPVITLQILSAEVTALTAAQSSATLAA